MLITLRAKEQKGALCLMQFQPIKASLNEENIYILSEDQLIRNRRVVIWLMFNLLS